MRFFTLAVFLFALFAVAVAVASSFAASPELTGRWRIMAVAGADGLDVARARAEFAPNGSYASTVGCNRMSGAATISAAWISFGPMMATRMACPPPLDRIERAYIEALQGVRGYRLSGKTLTFLAENGEALVALERAR
jgi:heat shock protein HslJ